MVVLKLDQVEVEVEFAPFPQSLYRHKNILDQLLLSFSS